MATCKNSTRCMFFKKYSMVQKKDEKVNNFLNSYCNGQDYQQCRIMQVMERLGEKFTPHNMLPDGTPAPGSNDNFWSEGVKLIVN